MGIKYEVVEDVGVITLSRGPLNLMTPAMHRQLYDVFIEFLSNKGVRCGILRGEGERAFSAGDDLREQVPELEPPTEELLLELAQAHRLPGAGESYQWSKELALLERYKPVVGVVRGWCLGGGLGTLLTLTDIRLASPDAKFGFPEVAYGMAGAGSTFQLSKLIPRTAAMSLLLTGEPINADEARRVHLINEVVPATELDVRAMSIARRIASHPPLSVRLEMEGTLASEQMTREEATRYGERLYQLQRLASGESEADSFLATKNKKM